MSTKLAAACALLAASCGPAEHPSPAAGSSISAGASSSAITAAPSSPSASSSPGRLAASEDPTRPMPATGAEPAPQPPSLSTSDAMNVCFPVGRTAEAMKCANPAEYPERGSAAEKTAIRCILTARFAGDDAARDLALGLYDALGSVTGVISEHTMDGGWRGDLHLVPELPVGQYRKHLTWLSQSSTDIDAFFTALAEKRPAGSKARYRHRALGFRFFRSVGRTTPSAYADGWEIAYNVSGSLHSGLDAVRETLFHEAFHLNDAAHGAWSAKTLSPIADSILARCGQKTACLAPYAPGTTMVRGGTYYAFQKGNGVHEYAAELATRYFTEHRTLLAGKRLPKPPFKCGPPENKQAWDALVTEFFGADLTGPCDVK